MIDRLVLENSGTFVDGEPLDYLSGHKTPRFYRNPFLMQAMTRLNMIDTMGYGIHRMFVGQAKRYFPLPDYDLSESGTVRLTIHGAIVDPAYSRVLIENTDLPLQDVFALDRVQKQLPIDDVATKRLRRAGLIEGRRPNIHISGNVASATDRRAEYIRNRHQDDIHYKRLILDFLSRFDSAGREDIDKMLLKNLSDVLTEDQKRNRVRNLLQSMRRDGVIENLGPRVQPTWSLTTIGRSALTKS